MNIAIVDILFVIVLVSVAWQVYQGIPWHVYRETTIKRNYVYLFNEKQQRIFSYVWIIFVLGMFMAMRYAKSPAGTVIILNGPSCSGKSSIQKEFQSSMMPDLWIKVGIDTLFDKPMPDITVENLAVWQKPNSIRWVETTLDTQENRVITLFTGDQGEKVAYGMNRAIAAYAQAGCNVIVDYIAYKPEWLSDLKKRLKNIKTYWVKVAIPLTVLEEREVARGTSPKGHARSHYNTVYGNSAYNLEVDSGKDSVVIIAQQIKDMVARNK